MTDFMHCLGKKKKDEHSKYRRIWSWNKLTVKIFSTYSYQRDVTLHRTNGFSGQEGGSDRKSQFETEDK